MTRRLSRLGWTTAILLAVAGATVTTVAQRPGGRRPGSGTFNQASYAGNVRYDGKFVFVRLAYPWYGGRMATWAHDYPRGEEHFLKIFSSTSSIAAHTTESAVMNLGDPELFKFPVAYMAEPGYWSMGNAEVEGLKNYLLKGGFLILDDFRNRDWANVELQVSRAFPEGRWVDLTAEHPIFHSFFEINDLNIVPQAYDAGRPIFRALFEDNDPNKRIMIIAAYNTDMSEFWEWSDQGYAPMDVTNEAYKIGINLFMYGLTH
jgi:hypothetical protein